MATTTLDLSADIIDTRDIIARIEELADELTTYSATEHANPELVEEHATLCAIMQELKGNGGDEQWEGDWYPVTLIRDSYFRAYAQDLAEDCGLIDHTAGWPMNCIDWDKATRELQYDHTSTEIDGVTYWYR